MTPRIGSRHVGKGPTEAPSFLQHTPNDFRRDVYKNGRRDREYCPLPWLDWGIRLPRPLWSLSPKDCPKPLSHLQISEPHTQGSPGSSYWGGERWERGGAVDPKSKSDPPVFPVSKGNPEPSTGSTMGVRGSDVSSGVSFTSPVCERFARNHFPRFCFGSRLELIFLTHQGGGCLRLTGVSSCPWVTGPSGRRNICSWNPIHPVETILDYVTDNSSSRQKGTKT